MYIHCIAAKAYLTRAGGLSRSRLWMAQQALEHLESRLGSRISKAVWCPLLILASFLLKKWLATPPLTCLACWQLRPVSTQAIFPQPYLYYM